MRLKNPILTLLLALAVVTAPLAAGWAVPSGFNIQGRLTDSNGVNRNGVYSLKFTIFDSATGGSNLWSKSFASVNVQNGNFQLILADPDDTSRLLSNAFGVLAPYLEIQVIGGPNIPAPESPLVPRQALASVPYAFQAGGIVSVGPATISAGGVTAITALANGNVGVGSSTPMSKLDVNGGLAVGTYAGNTAAPNNGEIISGNAGIGVSNPQSKLDVNGGFAVGTYAGSNTAPSNGAIISGSVGIGTPAPDSALTVNGVIHILPGGNLKFSDGSVQSKASTASPITTQSQPSRALNTVYQNVTGKPLFVSVTVHGLNAGVFALTDANPSPSTIVASQYNNGPNVGGAACIFFIVLPGNYYEASPQFGALQYWTEWN